MVIGDPDPSGLVQAAGGDAEDGDSIDGICDGIGIDAVHRSAGGRQESLVNGVGGFDAIGVRSDVTDLNRSRWIYGVLNTQVPLLGARRLPIRIDRVYCECGSRGAWNEVGEDFVGRWIKRILQRG